MTAERGHVLVVTKSDDWHPDQPVYDFIVECVEPALCNGWWECHEKHEVDGVSAADGPWACGISDPWCDEEEFTFHGVVHTWVDWAGWTVPFSGCVVSDQDFHDEARPIAQDHGEGRHLIEDEWEGPGEMHLTYVGPAEASGAR